MSKRSLESLIESLFKKDGGKEEREGEIEADHKSSAVYTKNVYMRKELFLYMCRFQHPVACLKLNTQLIISQ